MVDDNLQTWLIIAGAVLAGRKTQIQSRASAIRRQQGYRRGKFLFNNHTPFPQCSDVGESDRDGESVLGFDDLALIAVAYTFDDAHANLKRMM